MGVVIGIVEGQWMMAVVVMVVANFTPHGPTY